MPQQWDDDDDKTEKEFFQNVADALGLPDEYTIQQREREILDVLTSIFDNNSQFTVAQAQTYIDKFLIDDETHSGDFRKWIKNHRDQIAETFSSAVQSKNYNAATTSQDFMNAIYDEANAALYKSAPKRSGWETGLPQQKSPQISRYVISEVEREKAIEEAERQFVHKQEFTADGIYHKDNFYKTLTVLEGMKFLGKSKDEIISYLLTKPVVAWITDEEKEQYGEFVDKDTLDGISEEVRTKIERNEIDRYPKANLDEYTILVREFLRVGDLDGVEHNTASVVSFAYDVQRWHRKKGLVKLAESIGINCEGAIIDDIYELIKAKVREAAEVGGMTEFPDVSNKMDQIAADVPSSEYKPAKKEKVAPTKSAEEYVDEINALLDADSQTSESVEKIMALIEKARTDYPKERMAHKAAGRFGLKKRPGDKGSIYQLPVQEILRRLRERLMQIANGVAAETANESSTSSKRGRKPRAEPTEQDFANLADNLEAALSSNVGNDKAVDDAIERICENFKTELKFGVNGLAEAAKRLGLNAREKSGSKINIKKIKDYVRENGVDALRGQYEKEQRQNVEEFVEEADELKGQRIDWT